MSAPSSVVLPQFAFPNFKNAIDANGIRRRRCDVNSSDPLEHFENFDAESFERQSLELSLRIHDRILSLQQQEPPPIRTWQQDRRHRQLSERHRATNL